MNLKKFYGAEFCKFEKNPFFTQCKFRSVEFVDFFTDVSFKL